MAYQIHEVENQSDVRLVFTVLCVNVPPSAALHLQPEDLHDVTKTLDTSHWGQARHWAEWWTRERILRMFCKAFTLRNTEEWDATPNTNNPVVESTIPSGQ